MGRSLRFNTDDLKKILDDYMKSNEKISKRYLSYTDIAEYANKQLKFDNIRYYHFGRNKEIKNIVEEYNKEVEKNYIYMAESENIRLTPLDIKEFVNKNINNKENIISYLIKFQDLQNKLYDNYIKNEILIKNLEDRLNKEILLKKKIKEENLNLKSTINKLNEKVFILNENLNEYRDKEFITALNSTKLYEFNIDNNEAYNEDISKIDNKNGEDLIKLFEEYKDIF